MAKIDIMVIKKKVVKKKRKNEARDVLKTITGGDELEMAAIILKELAERKERQKKMIDLEKN